MDHKLTDALELVKKDLIAQGQEESKVDSDLKKLIYLIICRI